jgi:hypothetical protein
LRSNTPQLIFIKTPKGKSTDDKEMAEIQAYQQDKNTDGTPSGTSINLKEITRTDTGSKSYLDVSIPTGLTISKGDVDNTSFIHKFGKAPDFDTSDATVTIWDGANDGNTDQMVYQYSTTADIDSITSEDNGDDQVFEVQGLDANYAPVTQNATVVGSGYVALGSPLMRVFRIKNLGATNNAGHVNVYVSGATTDGRPDTAADVRAVMQPLNNQTLMAVYTIPSGTTGYMRSWYASTAGAKKTTGFNIELRARPSGGVFQLKHTSSLLEDGASYINHTYTEPEKFTQYTDIEMRSSLTAAAVTLAAVSAGFDIVLVNN